MEEIHVQEQVEGLLWGALRKPPLPWLQGLGLARPTFLILDLSGTRSPAQGTPEDTLDANMALWSSVACHSTDTLPYCTPYPSAQGLFLPHGPLGGEATVVSASGPDSLCSPTAQREDCPRWPPGVWLSITQGRNKYPAQETPGSQLYLPRRGREAVNSCCLLTWGHWGWFLKQDYGLVSVPFENLCLLRLTWETMVWFDALPDTDQVQRSQQSPPASGKGALPQPNPCFFLSSCSPPPLSDHHRKNAPQAWWSRPSPCPRTNLWESSAL